MKICQILNVSNISIHIAHFLSKEKIEFKRLLTITYREFLPYANFITANFITASDKDLLVHKKREKLF